MELRFLLCDLVFFVMFRCPIWTPWAEGGGRTHSWAGFYTSFPASEHCRRPWALLLRQREFTHLHWTYQSQRVTRPDVEKHRLWNSCWTRAIFIDLFWHSSQLCFSFPVPLEINHNLHSLRPHESSSSFLLIYRCVFTEEWFRPQYN